MPIPQYAGAKQDKRYQCFFSKFYSAIDNVEYGLVIQNDQRHLVKNLATSRIHTLTDGDGLHYLT